MGGQTKAVPPTTARDRWKALGALALVEAVAFGVGARGIGFYHDDWVLVEQLTLANGFWNGVAALKWSAPRPMDMLLYPALYALAGWDTALQHLLRMAADLGAAFLFYELLVRLTRLPKFALVAAALAIVLPNREVMHFWFAISNESWAIVLMFAGLLLHLDWLEGKGRVRLAGSLLLYAASVLMYEALAFFPLALATALTARQAVEGKPRPAVLKSAAWALLPFGPVLAGALLWQRVGAARLLGVVNNKAMGLSASHMIKVWGAAFECVSNRVLHITWLSLLGATRHVSPGFWAAGVAGAAACAWALKPGKDNGGRADRAAASAFAAGAFIAAYAPYALSAEYTPQVFGVMSRTNAGGVWPAAMLFATLALAAGRRSALTLGLLLFAFTMTDWYRTAQWAASWTVQRQIMTAMEKHKDELPKDAMVLLTDAPTEIQYAIVFDSSWDFDAALRIATGRPDLHGDVYGHHTHEGPNVFVYSYQAGTLTRRQPSPSTGN